VSCADSIRSWRFFAGPPPWPLRFSPALVIPWLLCPSLGEAQLTFPVPYPNAASRIEAASFMEDHGSWHAGCDLPRTATDSTVVGARTATVDNIMTSVGFNNLSIIRNENSARVGPWSVKVNSGGTLHMLDILKVRRVTPAKPVITYTVLTVNESPANSGNSDGTVLLVVGSPTAGDAIVVGDVLAVDYAFYGGQVQQIVAQAAGPPVEYDWYAHLEKVYTYVAWRGYPATAANRMYAQTSPAPPAERAAHSVTNAVAFANIQQGASYGTEPLHVHYTLSQTLNTPASAMNPLSGRFGAINDPQNNRPLVRAFALRRSGTNTLLNGKPLFGDIDVFLEARDNMGATEQAPDGDANNIREAGVYNAGYYLDPIMHGVSILGTQAKPLMIIMSSTGIDTTPPGSTVAVALDPQFRIDINTNYDVWVSHVNANATRLWRTNAWGFDPAGFPDGTNKTTTNVNMDVLFPDGVYKVGGRARDQVGFGTDKDTLVTVDNFRPYVRKVTVTQQGLPIYIASWELASNKLDLIAPLLKDRQLGFATGNIPIVFKVIVSESVALDTTVAFLGSTAFTPPGSPKTYQIRFDPASALKYDPQGGGATSGADLIAIQIDSLATTFKHLDTLCGSATIASPAGVGLPTYDGDAVLVVDLEDLSHDGTGPAGGGAGNRLLQMDFTDYVAAANQIDPSTLLTRNSATGAMRGTPGADKVHRFRIDTQATKIQITTEQAP
jgi:hypothetical protein